MGDSGSAGSGELYGPCGHWRRAGVPVPVHTHTHTHTHALASPPHPSVCVCLCVHVCVCVYVRAPHRRLEEVVLGAASGNCSSPSSPTSASPASTTIAASTNAASTTAASTTASSAALAGTGAALKRVELASDRLRALHWRCLPALEELRLDCPALTSLTLVDCDSLTDQVRASGGGGEG